jgi:aminoglycoside phosphotransferase (APT) family kinase protein
MTAKPWESDNIDPQLANQLISSQFSELDCTSLTLLGTGWDNVSFTTNDGIVFRFPRRQFSVDLLLNEISLLPYIQKYISLPVPLPTFIGSPTPEYPWPFAGYKLLSGETADRYALTREERHAFVKPIAIFLKELHHININELQARGAPFDSLGRVDISVRLPKILDYLNKIDEIKCFDTHSLREFAINFKLNTKIDFNCFVHGDLYARHILIKDRKNISGIIDWGDTHIGNAAVDIALIHSFLPQESHNEFRSIYGVIDDTTWNLAKFRALYSSATITVYGHDIQDQELLAEGLQGLSFINET